MEIRQQDQTRSSEPILRMHDISKSFGPVQALKSVSIDLYAGEVLALMGENGAGKSTLMNILSGSTRHDSGSMTILGKKYQAKNPIDARHFGVAKIHQELQVVPELSIAENVFLGRQLRSPLGFVRMREMERKTGEYLSQLEWEIDPKIKVKDLRIGEQQLVEIAKAISINSQIIIMDEPTSALSEVEAEKLFAIVRKLRNEGKGIIYITHRMEEVFKIADRLTVLRDGEWIGTKAAAETDSDEIIAMMVGRQVEDQYPKRQVVPGETVFEVERLSYQPAQGSFKRSLEDISFSVRSGEVLGVAGLAGSGRSELFECLFGAHGRRVSGRIAVAGQDLDLDQPAHAIEQGMALATEDRKLSGLVLDRGIGENISLPELQELSKGGFMKQKTEQKLWQKYMDDLRIKAPSAQTQVRSLSGGNQQKVVLAKWLATGPKVLLLDEPTRGIDVGAKEEIYLLINQLAAQGLAVLVVSSELPELIGISDRIITLCEGRLTGEFDAHQTTQEQLLQAATTVHH